MRTVSIRQLSGSEITRAAKAGETLGITNGGALCGVLVPIDQKWVYDLVEWNLSRVVRSVQVGEKAAANGELLASLDEVLKQPNSSLSETNPVQRVSIRDISAAAITDAAKHKTWLWITNDRVVCGLLIPITAEWVQQLIEQNVSRLEFNVRRGEKDLAEGFLLPSLSDEINAEKGVSAL